MRFVAIDVETANSSFSSICQIGLVKFENGIEVASEEILVNPKTYFDEFNVKIHGIDEDTVRGAKTFREIHSFIREWMNGYIIVSHTHFDRSALSQACNFNKLPHFENIWLDSAKMARRTWEQFAERGYGLRPLADHFGISFNHHNALHDARTAGLLVIQGLKDRGDDIENMVAALSKRKVVSASSINRVGAEDGPLVGENIVFTGQLVIPRKEAADRAAAAGASVNSVVTKQTTMLVVGDRDIQPGWTEKSAKHMKVEQMRENGFDISIVGEGDFFALSALD